MKHSKIVENVKFLNEQIDFIAKDFETIERAYLLARYILREHDIFKYPKLEIYAGDRMVVVDMLEFARNDYEHIRAAKEHNLSDWQVLVPNLEIIRVEQSFLEKLDRSVQTANTGLENRIIPAAHILATMLDGYELDTYNSLKFGYYLNDYYIQKGKRKHIRIF